MSSPENVRRPVLRDSDCIAFLQWALPRLGLRWAGFRKVHRQVCKRLRRRLNELGLETLDQYRLCLEGDPAEWAALDGLCHITISRFWRDEAVFSALRDNILPDLTRAASAESRPLRCWCAGCASGEEVYTLKLLWELELQPDMSGTRLEIIGTDIDEAVLRRAESGCYPPSSISGVPERWRALAFDRCGRSYCVRAAHRGGITFALQDIKKEVPPGLFDLILCRNLVFTYFEPDLQRSSLDRITAALREGGYLVIGARERLPNGSGTFERVANYTEIFRKGPRPDD
jgi:chemotaxis protein methyltransferase CheR